MLMVVKLMPLIDIRDERSAERIQRRLRGDVNREAGELVSTPIELMLMTWPLLRGHGRQQPMVMRNAPK